MYVRHLEPGLGHFLPSALEQVTALSSPFPHRPLPPQLKGPEPGSTAAATSMSLTPCQHVAKGRQWFALMRDPFSHGITTAVPSLSTNTVHTWAPCACRASGPRSSRLVTVPLTRTRYDLKDPALSWKFQIKSKH